MKQAEATVTATTDEQALAEAQHERIRAVGFHPTEWELAPTCPLCGTPPDRMLTQYERYQQEIWMVGCGQCGMIWLMRRLTEAGYRQFYSEGWYRRLVCAVSGAVVDEYMAKIQHAQSVYAHLLLRLLRMRRDLPIWAPSAAVLDLGGSSGMVGRTLADALIGPEAPVALVDPATSEQHTDRVTGYATLTDALSAHPDRRYALILICQTIDHLSYPVATLRTCADLLQLGGRIWVDILDTEVERGRGTTWWGIAKLDHPMYFTPSSAIELIRRAGLESMVATRLGGDRRHLGFLCRRKT